MTGLIILYVLLAVCVVAQIASRRPDGIITEHGYYAYNHGIFNGQSTAGAVISACSMLVLVFLWLCTLVDFPSSKPYAIAATVVVFAATLFNNAKLSVIIYFLIATVLGQAVYHYGYELHRNEAGTFELYHPATHWITHKTAASGAAVLDENIINSRGEVYNGASTARIAGIADDEGNLYIPRLCSLEQGYKQYEILFYNNDTTSVNVIKLTKDNGFSVVLDYYGHDTASEGYEPPHHFDNY